MVSQSSAYRAAPLYTSYYCPLVRLGISVVRVPCGTPVYFLLLPPCTAWYLSRPRTLQHFCLLPTTAPLCGLVSQSSTYHVAPLYTSCYHPPCTAGYLSRPRTVLHYCLLPATAPLYGWVSQSSAYCAALLYTSYYCPLVRLGISVVRVPCCTTVYFLLLPPCTAGYLSRPRTVLHYCLLPATAPLYGWVSQSSAYRAALLSTSCYCPLVRLGISVVRVPCCTTVYFLLLPPCTAGYLSRPRTVRHSCILHATAPLYGWVSQSSAYRAALLSTSCYCPLVRLGISVVRVLCGTPVYFLLLPPCTAGYLSRPRTVLHYCLLPATAPLYGWVSQSSAYCAALLYTSCYCPLVRLGISVVRVPCCTTVYFLLLPPCTAGYLSRPRTVRHSCILPATAPLYGWVSQSSAYRAALLSTSCYCPLVRLGISVVRVLCGTPVYFLLLPPCTAGYLSRPRTVLHYCLLPATAPLYGWVSQSSAYCAALLYTSCYCPLVRLGISVVRVPCCTTVYFLLLPPCKAGYLSRPRTVRHSCILPATAPLYGWVSQSSAYRAALLSTSYYCPLVRLGISVVRVLCGTPVYFLLLPPCTAGYLSRPRTVLHYCLLPTTAPLYGWVSQSSVYCAALLYTSCYCPLVRLGISVVRVPCGTPVYFLLLPPCTAGYLSRPRTVRHPCILPATAPLHGLVSQSSAYPAALLSTSYYCPLVRLGISVVHVPCGTIVYFLLPPPLYSWVSQSSAYRAALLSTSCYCPLVRLGISVVRVPCCTTVYFLLLPPCKAGYLSRPRTVRHSCILPATAPLYGWVSQSSAYRAALLSTSYYCPLVRLGISVVRVLCGTPVYFLLLPPCTAGYLSRPRTVLHYCLLPTTAPLYGWVSQSSVYCAALLYTSCYCPLVRLGISVVRVPCGTPVYFLLLPPCTAGYLSRPRTVRHPCILPATAPLHGLVSQSSAYPAALLSTSYYCPLVRLGISVVHVPCGTIVYFLLPPPLYSCVLIVAVPMITLLVVCLLHSAPVCQG